MRRLGYREILKPNELTINEINSEELKIVQYLIKIGAGMSPVTTFSEAECLNAPALEISGSWHFSYPVGDPQDIDKDLFEKSPFCEACHSNMGDQIRPFSVETSGNWKTKSVAGLHWYHDQLFVNTEAYNKVFKVFCDGYWEVLDRNGNPRDDIVQLRPKKSNCEIVPNSIPSEVCETCGIVRFTISYSGFFPNFLDKKIPSGIFRINSWFGSGNSWRRPIVCSPEVYQAIKSAKLKGVSFRPLEE